MGIKNSEAAFLREYQKKVESKMKEKEISVIQYWKDRLGNLISMKPDGIASLQLEMKKLSDMMENRIKTLKKDL
ncbi:MAG: hypothetical protein JXC33_06330 [Deltaproteobacteria bacterium]|nr:hypothetical protein [Deltaproteobacteria bacterium]